jgi:hypothetical protein
MSATLCLVTPMSASSMLASVAEAAWWDGMPRTLNEISPEVKIEPVSIQSPSGKGQGLGLQVFPFSVRNFVCCIITGASAPFFGQTT